MIPQGGGRSAPQLELGVGDGVGGGGGANS